LECGTASYGVVVRTLLLGSASADTVFVISFVVAQNLGQDYTHNQQQTSSIAGKTPFRIKILYAEISFSFFRIREYTRSRISGYADSTILG
jgi:hypothetical protein